MFAISPSSPSDIISLLELEESSGVEDELDELSGVEEGLDESFDDIFDELFSDMGDTEDEGTYDSDSVLAQAPIALRHLIFRYKFLYIRKIGTKRQLEKGVDGGAPGIDCGHSGRSQDHKPLAYSLRDIFQERRLSRPGLSRQEHRSPRSLHISLCHLKNFVLLHVHPFSFNSRKHTKHFPYSNTVSSSAPPPPFFVTPLYLSHIRNMPSAV